MLLILCLFDYCLLMERELYNKGIDVSLIVFVLNGEVDVIYWELLVCEMSYSCGIMMMMGMYKGDMLVWILVKIGCEFDVIVFIDDL